MHPVAECLNSDATLTWALPLLDHLSSQSVAGTLPFLDKISHVPITLKCFLSHLSIAVNRTYP